MNKVYFRYHRGTLSDSLATQFEISSSEYLYNKLTHDIDSFLYINKGVEHKYYGFDERCNQHLWVVFTFYAPSMFFDSTYFPIGFICYDKPELPEGFDK